MQTHLRATLFLAGISLLPLTAQEAAPSLNILGPKIEPYVDDQTIPGAVMLVGTKDKIIDVETVGYADLAAKKPMAADDVFWIASMSKAFCATATMMLVDEGKISVDDPLEKYIPEFKGDQVIDPKDPTHTPHRPNHPPTIREALSLSTGLPFGGGTGPGGQLDAKPLSAVAAIDGKEPLQFQPGTDFFYSNEGINACARIVEIVSGMPYETFLQQRIFDPLGMKDTTFWPTVEQQQRLAKCYLEKANPKRLEAVPYRQLTYPLEKKEGRYPVASGGLFSTAQDLAKFCQMFLNGGTLGGKQYLSPAAYKMMTTKEAPTKNYGFGWDLDKDGSYGHGGADQTYMGIDPKLGVVEIFLTQVGAPWVGNNIKKMHGVWEDANKEVAKDAAHAAGGHGT